MGTKENGRTVEIESIASLSIADTDKELVEKGFTIHFWDNEGAWDVWREKNKYWLYLVAPRTCFEESDDDESDYGFECVVYDF